jgi:hypothetical protein
MLSRLMFVYFIQRNRFLDNDQNYLSAHLNKFLGSSNSNQHQSFYRQLLRRLFNEGLGQPKNQRNTVLVGFIGNIQCLSGGLFDLQELEKVSTDLDMPNQAFKRLFAF